MRSFPHTYNPVYTHTHTSTEPEGSGGKVAETTVSLLPGASVTEESHFRKLNNQVYYWPLLPYHLSTVNGLQCLRGGKVTGQLQVQQGGVFVFVWFLSGQFGDNHCSNI